MPLEPLRITSDRVLVVEGEDERRFFGAFIKHHGLPEFQIMPIGGKTQLRAGIRALKAAPGFSEVSGLVVVRDADDNATHAFQAVAHALRDAELPVPKAPFAVCQGRPRTLVLIIANVQGCGNLEDLCLASVSQDPAIPCVDQYFDCLRKAGLAASMGAHDSKARAQAFLASRQRPGLRLGEAAEAGYWPFDSPAFAPLKKALSSV